MLEVVEALEELLGFQLGFEAVDGPAGVLEGSVDASESGLADAVPVLLCLFEGEFEFGECFGGGALVSAM